MVSILRGLYNGKIIPWERKEARNEAILELVRKIEDEERYFAQKMYPDDYERFQELSKLYSQKSFLDEENSFSYGFTLGLLLMTDVIKEAEAVQNE